MEPLARVATDLQATELAVDFKLEQAREGWQLFSVTFDPARVSSEHVRQILLDDGALIIPSPID
ncbi:MAG: hypothetical protein M3069_29990 [Chloroflexota bacterium]|nr:hypothetical protein [Chloroflexota bacterium]